jgi:hypothetical protein
MPNLFRHLAVSKFFHFAFCILHFAILLSLLAVPASAGRIRKVWQYANQDTHHLIQMARSAGDVNGDGYEDLIVGETRTIFNGDTTKPGVSYVFLGGSNGLSVSPNMVLKGSQHWDDAFGIDVAGVGDVNDDGNGDVIVGVPGRNLTFLYFGRPWSIGRQDSVSPDVVLNSGHPTNPSAFGWDISGAGLINGGAIPGIVVGAYSFLGPNGPPGRFFIFFGRRNWNSITYPDQELAGTDPQTREMIGRGVANIGDVTGDSYPDLLVGAPNNSDKDTIRLFLAGKVYVFTGGPAGVNNIPLAWAYGDTDWAHMGEVVDSVGRVFGRTYNDIFYSEPFSWGNMYGPGKVFLVEGGPTLRGEMVPHWVKEGAGRDENLGYDISGWRDVNGDGFSDFLVTGINGPGRDDGPGGVYLFFGGDPPSLSAHDTLVSPNPKSTAFGGIVTRIGRIDDNPWPKFLTSEAPNGINGNFYDLLTIWEWIETAEVKNLRAVAWKEKNTVVVGWDAAFEKDTRGYEVYRSLSQDTLSWSKISPLIAPDTTHHYGFADHSARADSTYYYWVRVIGKWAGRDVIGPVQGQAGAFAFEGLRADWLDHHVTVSWSCPREDGMTRYCVYRSEESNPPALIGVVPYSSEYRGSYLWSDNNISEGRAYSYWVGAVNLAGEEERFGPAVVGNYESALNQNYPNPMRSTGTRVAYTVGGLLGYGDVRASLKAYDVTGALVRVLVDETKAPGRYEAFWDGRDAKGRPLPSGVYFLRLEAGKVNLTRKLVVLR